MTNSVPSDQFESDLQAVIDAAGTELVRLYSGSAFELNAFDVTASSYECREDEFFLSTITNIPEDLKLPAAIEIDRGLRRPELVEHYRTEAIRRSSEDYLVRCVSIADACFEELYELALVNFDPEMNELKRQRQVRSAWVLDAAGRTNVATYLVDTAGLSAPPGVQSTVDMVMDRYCELRELRHALVHSGGRLSDKHIRRLDQLQNRLPAELRTESIAKGSLVVDGALFIATNEMLLFRQWFYVTIFGFFKSAFRHSYSD